MQLGWRADRPAHLGRVQTVDTVRVSIGIEHCDDLLADLEQALAAV